MTDKQRAVERVRRDLDGGDPASSDTAALLAEFDRLSAELAETRTVGDALAAGVGTWLTQGPDGPMGRTMLCPLVDMWAEVRGDAPAAAVEHSTAGGDATDVTAPAEPPAVELPVTLSSVDDVAAPNGDES